MPGEGRGDLGVLLKRMRESRGYTQKALAARAGVSQELVSHIETGRVTRPSRDSLLALAGTLGVAPDPLLEAAGRLDDQERRVGSGPLAAGRDLIAWIESRPDLVEELETLRRNNSPEIYQQVLAGLARAWEASFRLAMGAFAAGGEDAAGRRA
ncbi:MAG TPA: helix-turn-helix transcriptional regulator [Thermomicrobiales bacterium]|nr:helix-turn-helix transcriptional regulator [Thermomicrobiales bacterium]